MSDLLKQFGRSGKEWLGLWSLVVLLLCIYSVLLSKPIPEGVVESFGLVLLCYTGNRSLKDWAEKRLTSAGKAEVSNGKVDNPDA